MNISPIKILLLIFISSTFLSCKGQEKTESKIIETKSFEFGKTVSNLDDRIWVVFQDSQDNYWFGSNGKGIYHFDGKVLKLITSNDGLIDNTIRGIQEDNKGNIYIETPEGISEFDGDRFSTLKVITSPNNEWKLEPNDLWFGYNANDLYRYDGDSLFELKTKQEWKFDTADYSIKEIDSTELKKFVGDFKLPRNKVVSTFIYQNQLYAFAPWGEDYPLYYLGNNEFACEIGTVTFKFKEGKLKKMVIPHNIFKINGRLLNPSETKGVKSDELLGTYYCKDADATFEVKIEDCKLVLQHKKYGSIPLTQFKTLSFHLNNLWINKLWFTKEKGHITSFKIPLSEYEKLTFLKQ